MTAFVFVIVVWLIDGTAISQSGVFSSMTACQDAGRDIVEAANQNPNAAYSRWRCEEVRAGSSPTPQDDAPTLPPGHPPIGRRGA